MVYTALALIFMYNECAAAQAPTPPEGPQPVFTMSISVKQATVKSGSETTIDIAITNVSGKEIQVWRARSGPPPYTFLVTDRKGKAAPLTPMGEAIRNGTFVFKGKNGETRYMGGGSGSFAPVAGGATVGDALVITDFVDLSRPGRYTIRLRREDPYTKVSVESNSIVLTVTQPE
jgi:hypothetical protein